MQTRSTSPLRAAALAAIVAGSAFAIAPVGGVGDARRSALPFLLRVKASG